MTDEQTPWLTVKQAARRAQVGSKAVYAAIQQRKLKAVRVGTKLLVHVTWVDAWLEAAATPVNPDAPGPAIAWSRHGS